MNVRAAFVDAWGTVIVSATAPDYLAAVNRVYAKAMKIPHRPALHLVISTVK